jgi:hypothetical protein
MATTTPNFGWPVPTSTDLVKDGATAIEALGDSIDASLLDLKGGTTGQVLSKTSNTDLDFTWVTDAAGDITGVTAGTGISGGGTSGTVTVTNSMATAITTAGDLIKGTGSGTFDRLGIGSSGQVLTVSAGAPAWAAPSSASKYVLLNQTTMSAVASQTIDSIFSSSYNSYIVVLDTLYVSAGVGQLQLQYVYSGTAQTTTYYQGALSPFSGSASTGYLNVNNGSNLVILDGIYTSSTTFMSQTQLNITYAGATGSPTTSFSGFNAYNVQGLIGSGFCNTSRVYTGLKFIPSTGNLSGRISIYGVAN